MNRYRSVTAPQKAEILIEVIVAIDHYTDEDVPRTLTEQECKKVYLLKHLGIGPIMTAQLSVPLTKISVRHGGRGVGVYSAQGAETIFDCYALVLASITGEKP